MLNAHENSVDINLWCKFNFQFSGEVLSLELFVLSDVRRNHPFDLLVVQQQTLRKENSILLDSFQWTQLFIVYQSEVVDSAVVAGHSQVLHVPLYQGCDEVFCGETFMRSFNQALFLDHFPRYSPTRNCRILEFWPKFLELFVKILEFF